MFQELKSLFRRYDDKDVAEARTVLDRERERYQLITHKDLAQRISEKKLEVYSVSGESGIEYQIEVNGFWDDREGGTIRLVMAIDGGPISAYRPISIEFIKAPLRAPAPIS